MDKLTTQDLDLSRQTIFEKGRRLEKAIFQNHFEDGPEDRIVEHLSKFQNKDGGFGQALEPDFRLPHSSPAATAIAFQTLVKLDEIDEKVIKPAIQYLESTFDEARYGWLNVPKEVNDYPHASWWDFDMDSKQTVLDNHWGNPSAELVGYLCRFEEFVGELNVDKLVQFAIDKIGGKTKFESEHEVYSYIRLYDLLPEGKDKSYLEKMLIIATGELVSLNVNEWERYVPKPLDFVESPEDFHFGIYEEAIQENLDYLVEMIKKDHELVPSWRWEKYANAWAEARKEWIGILTLEALIKLDVFGRVER